MHSENPARGLLVALRLFGGGAWAAPHLAAGTMGLQEGAESEYVVRLFAARNLALAAGLAASGRRSRRLWWQTGIACDALDAAAGLLGGRAGKPRHSVVVDVGASLLATGLGVAGLARERA
jgi:hypothetical protein